MPYKPMHASDNLICIHHLTKVCIRHVMPTIVYRPSATLAHMVEQGPLLFH